MCLQKQVGHSGLTVSNVQWATALAKGSATSMATSLMMSMVPEDVLKMSNYKGGRRKINSNDDSIQCQALDKNIVDAIMSKKFKINRMKYNNCIKWYYRLYTDYVWKLGYYIMDFRFR